MVMVKQSTAVDLVVGPLLDDTDAKTPETGLTVSQSDVRLSKNGAAFAQKNDTNAATHLENGFYKVPLNTTDTGTLGLLTLGIFEAGALPVWMTYEVVSASTWDALFGTGPLPANVTQISGDGTAADNAESFFDGAGYAGTNNVIPLVTTVTNLTNAATSGDFTATQKTSITTAATAATPTAAAVTGAVGSVTGNVGGNVVGSVGSVTGNVGGNVVGSVGTVDALSTSSIDAILARPMPEAYSTVGGDLTVGKALYEIVQHLQAHRISSTTWTIYERDGTTPAFTLTLDDATTPTSAERAT